MQHGKRKVLEGSWKYTGAYPTLDQKEILQKVAEERASYGSEDLEKVIAEKQKAMEKAAKNLDFITAAKLRDEISVLKG